MKKILLIFLLIMLAGACIEKYTAPIKTPSTGYLVVEGFINSSGPTTIQLSRTTPLDTIVINPENFAQVSVEGDDNSSYALTGEGNGNYLAEQLAINPNQKYRIRIQTNDGYKYLSDFVEVKQTPAIDSVSWTADSDTATIFVTSHDPQNQTKYYQWEYEETWEYYSRYFTNLEYDNGSFVLRDPDNQISTCWRTTNSSNILLASSAKLSSDFIYQNPINKIIFNNSNKLTVEYSILVKQYAVTEAAYNYLSEMKKNSEQLGTIFDAQPSQLTGNIHCETDSSQPVIGYISACSEMQKRIFIYRSQLPQNITMYTGYESCLLDTLKRNLLGIYSPSLQDEFGNGNVIPLGLWYDPPGSLPEQGIIYASTECVDCREQGGTTQKPSFWP